MKLNDTHLILLTTASQRPNGSLIPLPASIGNAADRAQKAIAGLLRCGLVEEGEVTDLDNAWRQVGEQHFGARITQKGLAAIGIDAAEPSKKQTSDHASDAYPARQTKTQQLLTLLQRNDGATLDELTSAMSWLPHTTRAALTGLRKKGHVIEKGKRGQVTCWLVKAA